MAGLLGLAGLCTVEQSSAGLLRAFGMCRGTDVTAAAGYTGGYLFGFMLSFL